MKTLADLVRGIGQGMGTRRAQRSESRKQKRIRKSRESQFWLMKQRFLKHKLAVASSFILVLLYLSAVSNRFIAPYEMERTDSNHVYAPPSGIHFLKDGRLALPFVHGVTMSLDPIKFRWVYKENAGRTFRVRLFVKGYQWKLFGVVKTDRHLFGVEEGGRIFLFGTDSLGRDLFSRILYGSLVSLTLGWIGILIGLVLGVITGGISGFLGGTADLLIQRWNEVLMSYPSLPLWVALSVAVPRHWDSIRVYFAVSIILSLLSSGSLSRIIRGKVLSLKENDYVMAARALGADTRRILIKDIVPGCWSYILVRATLNIPGMILGESTLSFLGLGIRPPMCSWGTLLDGAQNIVSLAYHPWMMIPGLFIVVSVLAFNFVGDGLRDMADPYTGK